MVLLEVLVTSFSNAQQQQQQQQLQQQKHQQQAHAQEHLTASFAVTTSILQKACKVLAEDTAQSSQLLASVSWSCHNLA